MSKLELKHLAPYLPYGLKVQYKGIVNGKELRRYNKEFKGELETYEELFCFDNEDYNPPKEIIKDKVGYIKEIGVYLKHTTYRVGTKHHGLKIFSSYNPDFKPILHPLSGLGDEYIFKLAKYTNELEPNISIQEATCLIKSRIHTPVNMPYIVLQKLFEWHFDVFGLIEKGLAIDINTLTHE